MQGAGAAVLCESGAYKALTLDLAEREGLTLPTICNEDSPQLRAAIPVFVPVTNPLDLTAQGLADPDLYRRTLAAVMADERFGSVLVTVIQTDTTTAGIKYPPIAAALKAQPPQKPVVIAGLDEAAAFDPALLDDIRALGIPYFPTAERVIRAFGRLQAWKRRDATTAALPPLPVVDVPRRSAIVPEYAAKHALSAIGVSFPASKLVQSLEDAKAASEALGYPVVIKAQSADLPHKSEAGGVIIGLADANALEAAWARLHANLAAHRPGLLLDGVLVEAMGAKGVELIVGARNDGEWGPVLLVGFGGVQAEILKDVLLLPPDLSAAAIRDELDQLKSAALFHGFRGALALDVDAIAELVQRLGAFMLAHPEVGEIDLNPVVAMPVGEGYRALDALITWRHSP
jgi:acyl-CoA synthetase (NDP forming)